MTLADILILAIIGISGLLGLSRGLVREVLGLGAWLLAGYGAWLYGPDLEPPFERAIGNPEIADPAAYVVAFLVLLIVLSLLSNLVGRMVSGSVLGGLDRSLGLVFGLVRGAAILVAVYIPLAQILPPDRWPPAVQHARTLPMIYDGALFAAAQMPPAYRPRVPPPPGQTQPSLSDALQSTPQGSAMQPSGASRPAPP